MWIISVQFCRIHPSLLDETFAAAAEIWQRLETESRLIHLGNRRTMAPVALAATDPVHAPVKG